MNTHSNRASTSTSTSSAKPNDAALFVQEVKETFGNDSVVFKRFMSLLKAAYKEEEQEETSTTKTTKTTIDRIATRVIQLFRGHDHLILGFNQFLPEQDVITVADIQNAEREEAQNCSAAATFLVVPLPKVHARVQAQEDRGKCPQNEQERETSELQQGTATEAIDLTTEDDEDEEEPFSVNPKEQQEQQEQEQQRQQQQQEGESPHASYTESKVFAIPHNLKHRCIQNFGWEEEFTDNALQAYRQFMMLKLKLKDWDAKIITPPHPINFVWHQHILDVKHYANACQDFFGQVIGRNLVNSSSCSRQQRINVTKEAAKSFLGNETLNQEAWCFGVADGLVTGLQNKKRSRDISCPSSSSYEADNQEVAGDGEKRARNA